MARGKSGRRAAAAVAALAVFGAAAGAPVGGEAAAGEAVQHRRLAQLDGIANGLGGILCNIIPTGLILNAVGAPGWVPDGMVRDGCSDQLGGALAGSY